VSAASTYFVSPKERYAKALIPWLDPLQQTRPGGLGIVEHRTLSCDCSHFTITAMLPLRFGFRPGMSKCVFSLFVVSLSLADTVIAAESSTEDLLNQAKAAYASGSAEAAVGLATKAIEAGLSDARPFLIRAQSYERGHQLPKALADYNEVLKLDPKLAQAWQLRGAVHFKLAHIDESIADFDKFIELKPDQAPYHWQRGISYYYAGRFEDGRKQFELHEKVNPEDVENAAWHFLCMARSAGVEKARSSLIPVKEDGRIPMLQIHALFVGKIGPEDVLRAAHAGEPSAAELQRRLFYAHLYLGLFFEATGDEKAAYEHISKAARQYGAGDYMSDVARVHLVLREKSKAQSPNHKVGNTR